MRSMAVGGLHQALSARAWVSGFWIGLIAGAAMSIACVALTLWIVGK
jgi:hypothetical protein